MSLAPLLQASPAIQLHAIAAMAAFALGCVQLAAPKGTLPHRTLGYIWVALMVVVAARRHNVRRHRITMLWLFAGALVIAGLFTFMPGRIMHAVVFGS